MRIIQKVLKWVVVFFFSSTLLAVLYYKFFPVRYTPLMFIRCAQNFSKNKPVAIHHKWVPIDSISPYLPVAVIASEDQKFLSHHGFDYNAIQDATRERLEGRRMRGASTISQQTAKNVFLWPKSSWLRKGFEVYFTVLIEFFWSKERIIEVYLNSIEMGPNIYGAYAVAQYHFGCKPSQLRRSDCALIAATLPNPIRFSSLKPSKYMRKRQCQIKQQMHYIPFLYANKED